NLNVGDNTAHGGEAEAVDATGADAGDGHGGGIYASTIHEFVLSDSRIFSNFASGGDGASTFALYAGGASGGGVQDATSSGGVFTNCTFDGNRVRSGDIPYPDRAADPEVGEVSAGGLGSQGSVFNCTFSGNLAQGGDLESVPEFLTVKIGGVVAGLIDRKSVV